MQTINTVAGRSLFITILKTTAIYSKRQNSSKEALVMFLERGGWTKIGDWYSEMFGSKQLILLTQLIEVLALIPITIELLRASSIPKSLKNLSKFEFKPLIVASKNLLFIWKKYVKDVNDKKQKNADKPLNKQTTFLDSLAAAIETPEKARKRKVPLVIEKSDQEEKDTQISNTHEIIKKQSSVSDTPRTLTITIENQRENRLPENLQIPQIEVETTIDNSFADAPEFPAEIKKPPKKRVSFKEDALVQVFQFEMTEQERTEMHGEHPHLKFDEALQLELIEEKKAIRNAKNYNIEEDNQWSRAVELENVLIIRGNNSKEKNVQILRESNILPPIYIDKSQMPISGTEPMFEETDVSDEKNAVELKTNEETQPIPCVPYWENYGYPPKIPLRPPPITMPGQIPSQMISPFPIPHHVRRDGFKPRYPHNYDPVQRGGFRGRGRGRFYRGRGGMPPHSMNNFDGEFRDDSNYSGAPGDPNQPPTSTYTKLPPEALFKTVKCRHYMKGACLKGDACTFIHDPSNLQ